jgi:hypothetical protein
MDSTNPRHRTIEPGGESNTAIRIGDKDSFWESAASRHHFADDKLGCI